MVGQAILCMFIKEDDLKIAGPAKSAADKGVIFLLDGFSPEYISWEDMPSLRHLRQAGAHTLHALDIIPSLSNVNHVSLLTGTYPERHGITGNYYLQATSGREVFMDRAEYIQGRLLFERAREAGLSTMLVTAKEKLTRLLNRGLDMCVDATSSPTHLAERLGKAPSIYSAEMTPWVLRAAKMMAEEGHPDLMYIATTDYMEHAYGPQVPQMQQQAREMDALIGDVITAFDLSQTVVVVAADHGMNQKTKALSIPNVLAQAGIKAHVIPAIKDGLYLHHRNLGGAVYVYLEESQEVGRAQEVLAGQEGVAEDILASAAPAHHLPPEAVGDMLVLGEKEWALGTWGEGVEVREVADLRSHGSRFEQEVPLILAGAGVKAGVRLKSVSLVDLAPTVAHLLGLDKSGFQGRVLEEALKAGEGTFRQHS